MRFILSILLSLFIGVLLAQPALNKTYGSEMGNSGYTIIPEQNGYFIACNGYSAQFANWYCIKLYRVDSLGNVLWEKEYGQAKQAWETLYVGSKKSIDGGYLVTGQIRDSATARYSALLIKTDSVGDAKFTKIMPGITGGAFTCCVELPDMNMVVSGVSISGINGDASLFKLDTLGNVIWRKQYGQSDNDQALHLSVLPNGGFLISGRTMDSTNTLGKNYLIKTNSQGDTTWTRTYGVAGFNNGGCFADAMHNGDILLYGTANDDHTYVARLDSLGNVKWNLPFLENNTAINKAMELSNGDIVVAGQGGTPLNFYSGYICLLDSLGHEKFNRLLAYYGTDVDSLRRDESFNAFTDVQQMSDKGLALTGIAGYFTGGMPYQGIWLVKTDSTGCINTYCGYTGVEEINSIDNMPANLHIYPNPATNQATIELQQAITDEAQWTVYNLLGQQITTGKTQGQPNIKMEVSAFQKGWYVVKIVAKDKSYIGKFLVE